MRYKKWDKFKVPCDSISRVMSRPKNATDLTKAEKISLVKIQEKDELNEKDILKLKAFDEKRQIFLDPSLSESCKTFLIGNYGYLKYNAKAAKASFKQRPWVTKGVALEEQGIQMVCEVDKKNYERPTGYVENENFIGVCDAICLDEKHILDIKTSWNAANFMEVRRTNKLSHHHWAQMQGYLNLYDMEAGTVCYVLANTPPHLIQQEQSNLFNKYMMGEVDREKYELQNRKLDVIFNYEKIPANKRIIRFDVHKSQEYITNVIKRIGYCRDYLSEFDKAFTQNKNIVTSAEDYLNVPSEEDIAEYNPPEPLQIDAG